MAIGETRKRRPTGSLPLDATRWSGDHKAIKKGIGAAPADDVFIDREANVWLENSDGTFTNFGHADTYTGSSKAAGRRGKDRRRRGPQEQS